jgi:exopolyphosphatase/guanosine-5'-triphosphate,3'-diphosphate pyrophosphatase
MMQESLLAAVDLGSNSFRLQVARAMGDQVYPLDSLSEKVRLAGGLDSANRLDDASQDRALACLERFAERLRQFPKRSVRAVATNTLRVAKNGAAFLKRAQATLGFPIEVVAGREEARLIYLGVSHSLPPSNEPRLVVDIGGGSTELIIGDGFVPRKTESLYMGCVGYSLKFFPDGKITKKNLSQATLAACGELQTIAGDFSSESHGEAVASSGTARALQDILKLNGYSNGEITPDALEALRGVLIKAGDWRALDLPGLRADRAPVLPGGLAIMSAVLSELEIKQMTVATSAMREGILYDLLGRFHRNDLRETTVEEFMRRYHADRAQAERVHTLAREFLHGLDPDLDSMHLSWAAKLHEIGISVSHSGYHKHSAYIIENADMPGFSRSDQETLALLVLGHRGSLKKLPDSLGDEPAQWKPLMALRIAALIYRSRRQLKPPPIGLTAKKQSVEMRVDETWLDTHPLTAAALADEMSEWKSRKLELRVTPSRHDLSRKTAAA